MSALCARVAAHAAAVFTDRIPFGIRSAGNFEPGAATLKGRWLAASRRGREGQVSRSGGAGKVGD
ncbi:hypothetical protein ACU4GD_14395 [Cupriavidus basilensis]